MSERRDIKFEIQYLLSLTLVVFGLISVPAVRESVNIWVAYLVILFLATHLSIFNIMYGIGQTGLTVELVEIMDSLRLPTLSVIGLSFVFFILHTAISVMYSQALLIYNAAPILWEIVIKYVVPSILVGIMVYSVKRRGYDALSSFEGVNIKIVPEFLRVFPTTEGSKALLVKVENNGDEAFTYELDIEIPEVVTLYDGVEELSGQYSSEGVVDPGRADRYSFELSHTSQEHSAEILPVVIDSDGASYTTDVELELAV